MNQYYIQSMKGEKQNLEPLNDTIKTIKKEATRVQSLIECQKFRLTITQKSTKKTRQFNHILEGLIEQVQSQVEQVKHENNKYCKIIEENQAFFKRISQQKSIQDELCEKLLPRFEIMQKIATHSQEIDTENKRLNQELIQSQNKVKEEQKFCMQADWTLEQKQIQTNQLKKEADWQEKEKHRLFKLVTQYESQTEEMFVLKKKLNNDLQESKGNIRVYCRIRPAKTGESVISVTSQNTLKITYQKQRNRSSPERFQQGYLFQQIFNEQQNQQCIFTELSQLIQSSIDGKNVCIFAYGQTGSGKTYTLLGLNDGEQDKRKVYQQRGLVSRSIELIFKQIHLSRKFKWQYKAYLSIQEIYLQNIIDLIAKETTVKDRCTEVEVNEVQEIMAYLKESSFNRKMAATNMNQRSSRSHLIITVRLEGESERSDEKRKGSLVFVDLAGSQRLKQSKVEGQLLKQTQFINKSLSTLGTVINEMRKDSEHISFRNSKLTHVLQRYLEGQSKTLMFVNVSPDTEDISQTKLSLGFAQGVREVKVKK